MRTNLLYNKIVADTASRGFLESFDKIALPKLCEKYPDVDEVVIYEDYLSDGLTANGNFYCPLTLVKGASLSHAFASWRCDAKRFENSIPYSYVGKDLLNIEISDKAPEAINEKIAGRVPYFPTEAIKLSVKANAPTKTFLSGKYSQSFVDVMRENLTRALEREFNVSGVADSSLEITLMFAPESFMEHVMDNVSYRRVLISASSCAPRDLWIKWTRLNGSGTYTASNRVTKDEITFELCDEVPEKIREREYRYLLRTEGQTAYKSAMSRKNFTEWRELIKRVIKRGELLELGVSAEKTLAVPAYALSETPVLNSVSSAEPADEAQLELTAPVKTEIEDAFDSEISLKLQSVLESYNISSESSEENTEDEEINPDLTEMLRALIEGSGEEIADTDEENADTGEEFSEEEEESPPFDIDEPLPEKTDISEESYEYAETEETTALEALAESTEEAEEAEELEEKTSYDETPFLRLPISELEEDEVGSEISILKEEIAELKKKLGESEAESERLARLVSDYEIKLDEAKRERMILIENLDAAKRREERQRERLAEAARLAIASRSEADTPVYAEESAEAEPSKNTAPAISEPTVQEESATSSEESAIAEDTASKHEEESLETAPVRYVSKVADISFRHPVDPNITKRIQEIIVTTVKYFKKEDVYMKIKLTIPDSYMVRLEFVKIPENESELLADIIRVLGHSKLGITKVLLD